jgi:transmembrane sensor
MPNALEILERIKNGTATAEERAQVESWYLTLGPRKVTRPWIAIAASLVLLGTTLLWHSSLTPRNRHVAQQNVINDKNPGSNKAVLTLSDGSSLVLGKPVEVASLTAKESTLISSIASGILSYASKNPKNFYKSQDKALFNSVRTPRGGQYRLRLSDGTQVWLNAASAIRYPVVFNPKYREVELEGEAYFEVAKNHLPFTVKTATQRVRVLGTHFNINTYTDEASTKTTLLEGSVAVSSIATKAGEQIATCTLKPGQQSSFGNHLLNVKTVDTEEEVAWKNGDISFVNADLKSIMRQVARWYDVDVIYQGIIPERVFTGSISRNSKLSELLKILRFSKINFSMKGRELTVLP